MLRKQDREIFMAYLHDCFRVGEAFDELCVEQDAETEEDFLEVEAILAEKFSVNQEFLHEALLLREIMQTGSANIDEEVEVVPV